MKKSEIKAEFAELFDAPLAGIDVCWIGETIEVTVATEYSPVTVTFAKLKKISELFGTDAIDCHPGASYGGCETCDYGSSYEVVFTIQNPA